MSRAQFSLQPVSPYRAHSTTRLSEFKLLQLAQSSLIAAAAIATASSSATHCNGASSSSYFSFALLLSENSYTIFTYYDYYILHEKGERRTLLRV